jgi:hypothetical protein
VSVFPFAPAELDFDGGRVVWRVARCPICGEVHVHGAGRRGEDPRAALGHRAAHCLGEINRGYQITDISPERTEAWLSRRAEGSIRSTEAWEVTE